MKNLFLTIVFILGIYSFMNAQSGINGCVFCKSNELDKYSSAIGAENISSGKYSLASGNLNSATGDYSSAFGEGNQASGLRSFAAGLSCYALAGSSFALGQHAVAGATNAIVIGSGYGSGTGEYLGNGIAGSLMIGFHSSKPTFFVSKSLGGINATGKIGIGNVTAPEAKLHIRADNNEDASIMLEPTGSDYYAKLLFGDNGHQISAKANDNLVFSTAIGKDFVFENGNIGIGTLTPSYLLDVAGDIGLTGNIIGQQSGTTGQFNIYANTSSFDGACIYLYGDSHSAQPGQIKIIPNGTGDIELWGGGTQRMKILDNGNVGIGTINPVAQLELADIYDPGGMNLKIGNDVYLTDIDQSNTLGIYGYSDNTLGAIKLGSNGPKLYGIDGGLGIGTNEINGYRLAVSGSIHATEVKVQHQDNWYDYVFEDDYNLTSLFELEKFIAENKHLPDIPSEKEVHENGINLGEMNGILLKKIEELTLYVIEQQKEIQELKSIMTSITNQ